MEVVRVRVDHPWVEAGRDPACHDQNRFSVHCRACGGGILGRQFHLTPVGGGGGGSDVIVWGA